MKTNNRKSIRLYWGENFATKPKFVMHAIATAYKTAFGEINLYPGGWQEKALDAISTDTGFPKENLLIGNGIEGLLTVIFREIVVPGDDIVTLSPTFGVYAQNAEATHATCTVIPVSLKTQVTADNVIQKISKNTSMIFLASPNTMTGFYHMKKKEIASLAEKFSGILVVDECYFGIGDMTVMSLVKKHPNIIVLRSASKSYGLAGIRIGWAIAQHAVISKLKKKSIAVAPDPLPTVSYAVLATVIPYGKEIARGFVVFRNEFIAKLSSIDALIVENTDTTMIPVTLPPSIPVSVCIAWMKTQGIHLKDTGNLGYLLVGVPPKKDWEYMVSCFKKAVTLL